MSSFDIGLDDMLDFGDESSSPIPKSSNAVLREYQKQSPTNFRTTASENGYGNQQVSIANISGLMQGIPSVKNMSTIAGQSEYMMSELLGAILTDQNIGGRLSGGFDENVASDIRKKADAMREKGFSISVNSNSDNVTQTVSAGQSTNAGTGPSVDDPNNTSSIPASNGSPSSHGLVWPLPPGAKLSSGFGPRAAPTAGASKNHKGQDFGIAAGNPIYAVAAGTVERRKDSGNEQGAVGFGWYIRVTHANGAVSLYAHLSEYVAANGAQVAQGAVIGKSGGVPGALGAGTSTGAHLHFEYKPDGTKSEDPMLYLPTPP